MSDTKIYKDYNLNFEYIDAFVSKVDVDNLFEECGKLLWPDQNKPRRTSITFGDEGLIYSIKIRDTIIYRKAICWSGLKGLIELKDKVERHTKLKFNFCAILRYENGTVAIQKHKDKEMVLGSSICGVSIGDTRIFQLSPPSYVNTEPLKITLSSGSMYIMHPPTNSYWMHEILTEPEKTMRYSLTFRNVPENNLIKEIPVYPKCQALLKSGPKKDQVCGANIKDGTACKRHKK